MRDEEGATWREIAIKLGVTESAVAQAYVNIKSKLEAAKRTLREAGVAYKINDYSVERALEAFKRGLRGEEIEFKCDCDQGLTAPSSPGLVICPSCGAEYEVKLSSRS